MSRPVLRFLALGLMAVFALTAGGCSSGSGSLLSGLRLSSQVVAPTGKGDTPPIAVAYSLSRPATISAYVAGVDGQKRYLRKDELRPVEGEYQFPFSGAYAPDAAGDERRVLPVGSYQLVVEARDSAGIQQQATAQLQVRDADTIAPAVERLTLFPGTLSPNSDGIDDTTAISFRTTKQATVTLFLLSKEGKRYLLERQERELPGEHATTWNGQVGGQLLPSGEYRLVVEAEDAAGNVTVASSSVRLESSSMPDAHLLAVDFEPQRILLGGTVKVTIRVKNTGSTVLRTQGPDPGYSYNSGDTFSSVEGGKYREQAGVWRVGVDWTAGPASSATASSPGSSGSKYPYRWGFGKDLQPGEEATVVGYVRLQGRYPQIALSAGLLQETVRYWDNEVGRTVLEIGY